MDITSALTRLREYQDRVARLLAEASGLVKQDPQAARASLSRLHWELNRQLREYQVFKHTEIFDPIIGHRGSTRALAALRMKERCTAIGDAFVAHTRRWMTQDVGGQWDAYVASVGAIVQQLRQHLDREAGEAVQLLAGLERTRQGER